jgi:hypothetical protein
MRLRFGTIATVVGCAVWAALPAFPVSAAGNTIYLTIKTLVQGAVTGQSAAAPPAHEYKLENFSQNGNNFTATTPLDGSSSYILTLNGKAIASLLVRLDGHTMDDAFQFADCTLKSDSVTANSSTAALKVSFTCLKMSLHVSAASTPSPRPDAELPLRTLPLAPSPTPSPKK